MLYTGQDAKRQKTARPSEEVIKVDLGSDRDTREATTSRGTVDSGDGGDKKFFFQNQQVFPWTVEEDRLSGLMQINSPSLREIWIMI